MSQTPGASAARDSQKPKKRTLWPFALLGVAGAAVGGFFIVRAIQKETPAAAGDARDMRIVASIDAAIVQPPAALDAAIDASIHTGADPRDGMAKLAAGKHAIGAAKSQVPDALPQQEVTLGDFWIDRDEMTLGGLRAALGDKLPADTLAKTKADTDATPARFVDWTTAAAACTALGKRLPTEAEWEVAARTTPQDSAKARLRRTGKDADLTAAATDCSADKLCDMLGGLHEWTADDWKGKRGEKVVRGASYTTHQDGQLDSIHSRVAVDAKTQDNTVGFRCVYPASPPTTQAADAPNPPKPPPQVPRQPPRDDCSNGPELRRRGRDAAAAGQDVLALALAEQMMRCGDNDRAAYNLAAFAACRSRNAAKARHYFPHVGPARRAAVREVCSRNQIELPP